VELPESIGFNTVIMVVDYIEKSILYSDLHNSYHKECNKTFPILCIENS